MEEINLQEIAEIELFILKRMKEFTLGDHASVFKGSGFNFVGIRDWEPGDRMSNIDWAQSSLNNFSPLVTREFDGRLTVLSMAVAWLVLAVVTTRLLWLVRDVLHGANPVSRRQAALISVAKAGKSTDVAACTTSRL